MLGLQRHKIILVFCWGLNLKIKNPELYKHSSSHFIGNQYFTESKFGKGSFTFQNFKIPDKKLQQKYGNMRREAERPGDVGTLWNVWNWSILNSIGCYQFWYWSLGNSFETNDEDSEVHPTCVNRSIWHPDWAHNNFWECKINWTGK